MRIYSIESVRQVKKRSGKHLRTLWQSVRANKRIWLTWMFRLLVLGFAVVAGMFIYFSFTLPDPNTLLQRAVAESTKIYDRNGEPLYEIHGEAKRTLIPIDQISDNLKNATVAVEDKDFYKHSGISFRGLARAVWVDITSGSKQQGGSTITQQFVKNALLTKDKRFIRKFKEIILSIELEARYSKEQILQLYLNEIPYGRGAYGAEAASQAYFRKSAKDLSLAESAYMAAFPQSTTYYNPLGPHRDALDRRQQTILGLMEQQGYITKEQKEVALNEKVTFAPLQNNLKAPHFVLYVQDYLADKYGERTLEEGGLKVYTTIDYRLQELAEKAISDRAEKNAKTYNANNEALVAIDPKTGQILAMVGSKDFFGQSEPAGCRAGKDCVFDPSVNIPLSPRQPGSSFKPYVYLTAFKKEFGYSPASMLLDVSTNFGNNNGKEYRPKNYTGAYFGPLSMRQALAGSLNIPAVKTLALVGVNNAIQTARDLGITGNFSDCGLSLVLGGCDVRLLDHTAAYATLANGGVRNPATPILKIQDRNGATLEEYKDQSERVVDEQAVYELTSIMSDNNARSFIFGVNNPLTLPDRPVACKTGTTNEWRDGWTMCFTPSLAVGVWAGNNDFRQPMKRSADGVVVAAPIVNNFMVNALKGTKAEQFKEPEGIQRVVVDTVSGKLPTDFTPQTKEEVFASYSVPKDYDNVHVAVKIDKTTGLAATNLTPPENIILQTYTVFRSEKPENTSWEEAVRLWVESKGITQPPAGSVIDQGPNNGGEAPTISINEPEENGIVSQIPFTVTTTSTQDVTRVDLLIDGQLVESKTVGPFSFTVTKRFTDGQHILAVHAINSSGKSADVSIPVTFSTDVPIVIVSPQKNALVSGPIAFQALSGRNLGVATFYVNDAAVGTSSASFTPQGGYAYSLLWDSPTPGPHQLQIKAGSTQSAKINFTVQE